MAIFTKKQLADYIEYIHFNVKGKRITPIKLQKGMYFLFAIWGGDIRKAKMGIIEDPKIAKLKEQLFVPKFQAWTYGPVDYDLFKSHGSSYVVILNMEEFIGKLEKKPVLVQIFLDTLLKEIFEAGDFSLVDSSHQDECWKRHYNPSAKTHNELIPEEEIINEYASRN